MTEIFVEPELENLSQPEIAAEWAEICKELGLEKQLKHSEKSEENQAPPYMYIDPKTECIIRTLCPRLVKVTEYSASTIPVDVLREIKRCNDHGWYSEIKIAYDDKSPDPFVIGYTHDERDWNRHKHLIARWGAELIPFELLESKAIERLRVNANQALHEMRHKINFAIESVDLFVSNVLGGKEVPKIDFTISNLSSW